MAAIPPIHTILSHGFSANPKNWQFPMSLPADLSQAIEQLFSRLEETNIAYTLIGGIAMLAYIEGRNTVDIGFIMGRLDADAIGLVVAQEDQNFARASFQGIQVDLLMSDNPLFHSVQSDHAQAVEFSGRSVRVATPLGLCILRLSALPSLYQQGQLSRAALYQTDILQLTLEYPVDLRQAVQAIAPYLSATELSLLVSISVDIRHRVQRMRDRNPAFDLNGRSHRLWRAVAGLLFPFSSGVYLR